MRFLIVIAVVIVVAMGLTACGSLKGVTSTLLPESEAEGLQIAVNEVMDEIIDGDAETQEKVIRTIEDIRAHVNASPEARAKQLVDRIRQEVPFNDMGPTRSEIARVLLDRLEAEIQERHEDGAVDNKQQVTIKTFLDMVENAAYEADLDKVVLA